MAKAWSMVSLPGAPKVFEAKQAYPDPVWEGYPSERQWLKNLRELRAIGLRIRRSSRGWALSRGKV